MFQAIRNQIGFPLRRLTPQFRKKPYSESLESAVTQDLLPVEIASGYREATLRTTLFYAWLLSHIPWKAKRETGKVLDIGSKNFFYASALYFYAKERLGAHELLGIEVDPFRLYVDFYRRGDYAAYYAGLMNQYLKGQGSVSYEEGDWLTYPSEEKFDLITCFFPFLYKSLHDGWGLPRAHYDPEYFYRKLMVQTDSVVLFHQGEKELQDSVSLIKKIGTGEVVYTQVFSENPWVERKHPVAVLLWEKSS